MWEGLSRSNCVSILSCGERVLSNTSKSLHLAFYHLGVYSSGSAKYLHNISSLAKLTSETHRVASFWDEAAIPSQVSKPHLFLLSCFAVYSKCIQSVHLVHVVHTAFQLVKNNSCLNKRKDLRQNCAFFVIPCSASSSFSSWSLFMNILVASDSEKKLLELTCLFKRQNKGER